MPTTTQKAKLSNIFLRMHPLQRVMISLAVSAIVFFIIRPYDLNKVLTATILWDAFALMFILCSWIVFFTCPVSHIAKLANKEDGSRLFVFIITLVTSFASMFTVLLFIIYKDQAPRQESVAVALSVTGMIVSWIMVHTIFTFHYAHLYYNEERQTKGPAQGLDFPDKKKPDYVDFAYFSFVIGMTFQVSDVRNEK